MVSVSDEKENGTCNCFANSTFSYNEHVSRAFGWRAKKRRERAQSRQQTNIWSTFKDEFFAKLSTDGRITVPWEIRWKLEAKPGQMMRLFLHP